MTDKNLVLSKIETTGSGNASSALPKKSSATLNGTTTLIIEHPPSGPQLPFYQQSSFVIACLTFLGILATILMNHCLHKDRLKFEKESLVKKQNHDEKLNELKFEHDKELAERKFQFEKDQKEWERRVAFAETALEEFYDVRSRLAEIRTGIAYQSENDERIGRSEENDILRERRDRYYPIIRRFQKHTEFFNSMYSRRHRARAIFGANAETAYAGLWSVLMQVNQAANWLVASRNENEANQGLFQRMEEAVWNGLAQPDRISVEVNNAINLAEDLYQPAIAARPPIAEN